MISTQAPLGPIAIVDMVELETIFSVGDQWENVTSDEQQRKNADYIKKNHLDRIKLGVKSGEGFYRYPDPEFTKPEFLA